jgi:hypothetical protein
VYVKKLAKLSDETGTVTLILHKRAAHRLNFTTELAVCSIR